MSWKSLFTKENAPKNRDWKEKNKGYLRQMQKFLDVADNIEREDLRKSVIAEMLKCDMILTELAERQMRLISRNESKKERIKNVKIAILILVGNKNDKKNYSRASSGDD